MASEEKTPDTVYDRLVRKAKNHPAIAVLLILVAVATGIGAIEAASSGTLGLIEKLRGRDTLVAEYCTLVAPLVAQLDRTKAAFDQWTRPDLEIEVTIKDGNERARAILMDHAALVHDSLLQDARALLTHYDQWLTEYRRLRVGKAPNVAIDPFVFVYSFPKNAEVHFRERLKWLKAELGRRRCT